MLAASRRRSSAVIDAGSCGKITAGLQKCATASGYLCRVLQHRTLNVMRQQTLRTIMNVLLGENKDRFEQVGRGTYRRLGVT